MTFDRTRLGGVSLAWVPGTLLLMVALIAPSLADAADLAAWKKDGDDPSYFVEIGEGKWFEAQANGSVMRFEQLHRGRRDVELIDRGRNIKIKLHTGYAELSNQGRPYVRWINGGWTNYDKLPEYAKFSPIDHKVRLIYFLPTDREPTANYREKINTLMSIVNDTYKFEFKRRGLPDRGLDFQLAEDGQPIVHLVKAKHPTQYYNGAPNYDTYFQLRQILPEIPKSIGSEQTHLLVTFAETYDPGPNQYEWPGGIALGGWRSPDGGTATFSAWVLQDMFCATNVADQRKLFRDSTPIEGRTALGHGRMNSPRFEFIEDGMGAVVHEVGHALGLPHDQRDDRHYIMGNGFRTLRSNLISRTPLKDRARFSDANARILASSRLLNPEVDKFDTLPPEVELTVEPTGKPNRYKVRIQAKDDRGVKAVLYYDDVKGCVAEGDSLEGTTAENEMELEFQTDKEKNEIRAEARVIDQGGNITTARVNRAP